MCIGVELPHAFHAAVMAHLAVFGRAMVVRIIEGNGPDYAAGWYYAVVQFVVDFRPCIVS